MIFLGICGKIPEENAYLEDMSKEIIAINSDEKMEISIYNEISTFQEYVSSIEVLDLVYIDVTLEGAVELAEKIRKVHSEVRIMLIADLTISPVKYIKPGIMAAALVLRPFEKELVRERLEEVLSIFSDKEEVEGRFSLEYKGERVLIPYENILYFESREKKIFVGLENTEYGFYDTMKSLEEKLPKCFIRCSQSYIFNHNKLKKIVLNENVVELYTGITLPISRRYRKKMKEL